MTVDDRVIERRILLKRAFPRTKLFNIGKRMDIPYFQLFTTAWDVEEDDAALEIASAISDTQLEEVFREYKPREWIVFRGRCYTLADGLLLFESSWEKIRKGLHQAIKKYGKNCERVLEVFVETGRSCGLTEIKHVLKKTVDPLPILETLGNLKVIVTSYEGDKYQEWKILEETLPLVRSVLGMAPTPPRMEPSALSTTLPARGEMEKLDYVEKERKRIQEMDSEFQEYLSELLRHRLDATVRFGKQFSLATLSDYLQEHFGKVLYFDSLLSVIQQYSLADVKIMHQQGKTGKRTGWNLSLFGEPGTGKTFPTHDMILGKSDAKVPPHGIPGRNRYAGGITPARFIRVAQAYVNRVFNFVVPEFNDWFRYKGMVDPLKLAMERGEIKYEMHREVVGPYRFNSFFSVNYNVATFRKGYEVTVQDPNFNAIEDRMLCRLHRLTKQRYLEIAQSQMRLVFGEIDLEKGAQQVRDHLTLVYAIETKHPLVESRFKHKTVMLNQKAQKMIENAREAILEHIPHKVVRFSARLEDHAIRFACAASLLNYFHSNLDFIPVSEEALRYAIQLFVEEASVRSREEFDPQEVLKKLL
jgi:hypothetical protein